MTVTRSSGSGMRDLPCAGDGNRPGFSHPRISRPGFSRPGFQHQLLHAFSRPARKDATNRNLLRQKLYCLHLQEPESKRARALLLTSLGARAQESKSARARESKKARKRTRTRKQEREWQNPVPFKENYPPPRTCHSLIGCSPSAELSSRGRQSTWGGELPLAHAQIICLPLRTQDVSAIL